jgi:DNA-binding ferritin-like protein (Dps family)
MVRCDDFYCKWQKVGNFCEKHPKTAERIEAYLNKILPLLEELAAESEILNDGSRAMAPELTERASRPLIYEKDPEIRQKAIKQIVKLAEEKVIDGKRPQVTNREVAQIVEAIKEPQPPARPFRVLLHFVQSY